MDSKKVGVSSYLQDRYHMRLGTLARLNQTLARPPRTSFAEREPEIRLQAILNSYYDDQPRFDEFVNQVLGALYSEMMSAYNISENRLREKLIEFASPPMTRAQFEKYCMDHDQDMDAHVLLENYEAILYSVQHWLDVDSERLARLEVNKNLFVNVEFSSFTEDYKIDQAQLTRYVEILKQAQKSFEFFDRDLPTLIFEECFDDSGSGEYAVNRRKLEILLETVKNQVREVILSSSFEDQYRILFRSLATPFDSLIAMLLQAEHLTLMSELEVDQFRRNLRQLQKDSPDEWIAGVTLMAQRIEQAKDARRAQTNQKRKEVDENCLQCGEKRHAGRQCDQDFS